MKTYARIENGVVAELFATDADPALLFHPELIWLEVSAPPVAVGWLRGAGGLEPPALAPAAPMPPAVPTVAELQAQLAAVSAQLAALAAH